MKFLAITVLSIILIQFLMNRRVTVFEFERGLKYSKGKFVEILQPGKYTLYSPHAQIRKVDMRSRMIHIAGQEVLSSDGVSVKVSLSAEYEMVDPYLAVNKVEDYAQALYTVVQLVLRDVIGALDIEAVIASRVEINSALNEQCYEKALEFGLKIKYVGVKDMMFPAEIKKIFSQVVQARKEALAKLEKTRGETAALRNLANVSKLLESNPALLKLKLLETTGNTLVVGLPEQFVDVKGKQNQA